jgi:hypothetical protein
MTGPIRDTTGERIQDAFVESPTRANKTAVEVYVGDSLKVNSSFSPENLTPFGILKSDSSTSVFESIFNFDKQPLIWNEVLATGGTNTWNTTTNTIDLLSTTANGSSVIVQSKSRIRYNASRSVLVQISGNFGGLKVGCRRRIGQFDANNGLFFECSNVASVVIRSNATGSIVDTIVAQSAWNIDKLDGTGASGLTLDLTKHQLFVIEYGWQGIAAVKFGVYINGKIQFFHQFNSSNTLTIPYMKTANLPIRLENTNTTATASNTTMSVNCVAVKNFGNDTDNEGSVLTFVSPSVKTVSAMPTFTPVLSVRLNAANINAIVELLKAPIYGQTADDVVWKLILNPTLTGATFANSIGYVQIDNAATALTGGTDLVSGFTSSGKDSGLESLENFKFVNTVFGSTQAGASDVITLAASSRATTAGVWSSITWRQF